MYDVLMVLRSAFDLQDYQKLNGPEWLNIDMFDIAAKLTGSATKDQMRVMLQEPHRGAISHGRAPRETGSAAYVMIAAKGGVRLVAPKDAASKTSRREIQSLASGPLPAATAVSTSS